MNERALLDGAALIRLAAWRHDPTTPVVIYRRSSSVEAEQTVSHRVVQVGRLIIVFAAAALVGVSVAFASAFIGHEVLVRIYGENLAPIDDTIPMILAVWTAYLAGGLSAVAVTALGWRRFVRPR